MHHQVMPSPAVAIDSDENHGILLTRFLEKEWDALRTTRGAWCRSAGLADSTVMRWSQGVEPDIRNMKLVAEGLRIKLVDVLFHAGFLTESELRVRTVAAPREPVEIAQAIRNDKSLSDTERKALLAVHAAFQAPPARGGRRTVRVSDQD